MGRGNAIIRQEGVNYSTFYIEYYQHNEELNEDGEPYCDGNSHCHCNDTFYDDVMGNIECSIMPKIKSMRKANSWIYDGKVIFESYYIKVVIVDNEWSMAIGVVPVERADAIYIAQANKFMRELHSMYQLHTRTSAWTSEQLPSDYKTFY